MKNSWIQTILPHPTQAGQIGGHEGVGTIVKLGIGAEASGCKLGDRVGIKWIMSACLTCGKKGPFPNQHSVSRNLLPSESTS